MRQRSRTSGEFFSTPPPSFTIEGIETYQPLTDIIFQRIDTGALEAVTSAITLAECLVHPYRHGNAPLIERFRKILTAGKLTHYVGVDGVVEPAAQLRAQHHLLLADAFQMAVALASHCDAFLTNDATLKRIDKLSVLVLDELEL